MSTPIITAKFQVFVAVNPFGRIMQVWATPAESMPEVIATDYPDPDNCVVHMVCATNSYSEAFGSWEANASACRSTCQALNVLCTTLNSHLED